MAKFVQGVHGQFSGRIGNIVGSSWKGKGVMRIRAAKVSNPRTDKQQTTRVKFSLAGRFTARMSSLIADGFKSGATGITAQNAAMMYNLRNGLAGTYPDLILNFSELKISMGDLPFPVDMVVTKSGTNGLQFTWTDNSSEPGAALNDVLCIGIYNPEKEKALKFIGLFQRSQATGLLQLPSGWLSSTVHVYAFFKSQTHTTGSEFFVSESAWLGSFDMSA